MQRIKTAILGAGGANIATANHLPGTLAAENLELVALADLNPAVADYAQKAGVKAYTNFDDLLADPEVEMVQVATPDWLHCAQAEAALAAGKHVLLQKPPCLTRAECARLRRAAAGPARLQVSLNQRETKLTRTIKQMLGQGAIGELREIVIRFRGRRYPITNPASPYLRAECGGVWVHNGMHWLDEAFSYSEIRPSRVQVFTTKNELGPASVLGEGPNYWSAFFEMGPVTFQFEYNTMLTADGLPGGMRRELIGTTGELRQDYGGELTWHRLGQETPQVVPLVDEQIPPEADMVHSFKRLLENFSRQIQTGVEVGPRLDDSLFLMEALLRGAESARENRSVELS